MTTNNRSAAQPLLLAWLLLALSLFAPSDASAADPFEIKNDAAPIALRSRVVAISETNHALSPEEVADRKAEGKPHPLSPPNYGRSSVPVWGYISLIDRLPQREWILIYSLSTVEDVRVYIRRQGEASFHQLPELSNPTRLPFTGYRSATYSLTLDQDVPTEVVTRLDTRAPIGYHLQLWTPKQYIEQDRETAGLAGVTAVVPLVVLVYLLILSTVLRQRGLISLMLLLVSKLFLDAWVTGLNQVVLPTIPRTLWPTIGFAAHTVFAGACAQQLRKFLDLHVAMARSSCDLRRRIWRRH